MPDAALLGSANASTAPKPAAADSAAPVSSAGWSQALAGAQHEAVDCGPAPAGSTEPNTLASDGTSRDGPVAERSAGAPEPFEAGMSAHEATLRQLMAPTSDVGTQAKPAPNTVADKDGAGEATKRPGRGHTPECGPQQPVRQQFVPDKLSPEQQDHQVAEYMRLVARDRATETMHQITPRSRSIRGLFITKYDALARMLQHPPPGATGGRRVQGEKYSLYPTAQTGALLNECRALLDKADREVSAVPSAAASELNTIRQRVLDVSDNLNDTARRMLDGPRTLEREVPHRAYLHALHEFRADRFAGNWAKAGNLLPVLDAAKHDWEEACKRPSPREQRYGDALSRSVTPESEKARQAYLSVNHQFEAALKAGKLDDAKQMTDTLDKTLSGFEESCKHLTPVQSSVSAQVAQVNINSDNDLLKMPLQAKAHMVERLLAAGKPVGAARHALVRVYQGMQLDPRFKAEDERRCQAIADDLSTDPVSKRALMNAEQHWDTMSGQAKLAVLQRVVDVQSRHLGLPVAPRVEMGEGTKPYADGSQENAHYDPATKNIYLNPYCEAGQKTFPRRLYTVIHECAHRYEYFLAEKLQPGPGQLDQNRPEYVQALAFDANTALNGYIDGKTDPWTNYRHQPIETYSYYEQELVGDNIRARILTAVAHDGEKKPGVP